MNKKGFTILELIMVMVIIGSLSVIMVNNYQGVHKRSRDTQRKSDLNQYRVALETFANNTNGLYPGRSETKASDNNPPPPYLCADLGLTKCPYDPKDGESYGTGIYRYYYSSNNCDNGTACATQYILWTRLENENGRWFICSNGKSGRVSGTVEYTNGTCPF